MKLINAALAEKNLKLKQLPSEIQQDVLKHKEMIVKYNMACDEYENEDDEDEEIEKKLDEQEDFLASYEAEIADKIRNYSLDSNTLSASGASGETEEPTEKKGSSAGWLIFGGAVLIVTLGAVNVFKKRA
jgi:hypothetical protein